MDDQMDLVGALADAVEALIAERREMVALLVALIDQQQQATALLTELAEDVDALAGAREDRVGLDAARDNAEALRRESRQTVRQSERVIQRSRALLERAAADTG